MTSKFGVFTTVMKGRRLRTSTKHNKEILERVSKFVSDFTETKSCSKALETLKVPKREIFVTELFILSDPIWVGDLRNEPNKPICVKC